jgi:hypothetical protein
MVEPGVEINAAIENAQPIQKIETLKMLRHQKNALNWNVSGTWLF